MPINAASFAWYGSGMSWSFASWARGAPRISKRSATRGGEIAGLTLALLLLACAAAAADCTCRAQGRDYHHDQRICLSTPSGPRLAICGMDQNVASWIFSTEPCAFSARAPSITLAAAALRPGN